jgi:hypothetical protein
MPGHDSGPSRNAALQRQPLPGAAWRTATPAALLPEPKRPRGITRPRLMEAAPASSQAGGAACIRLLHPSGLGRLLVNTLPGGAFRHAGTSGTSSTTSA